MSDAVNQDKLQHAVDLVCFEQWLRFYFIAEEDGELYIRVPAEQMESTRRLYPQLYPVANALNNCRVDHQAAMNALRENLLSGPFAMTGQDWADVLSGQEFRLTLQLMSFWVQAEEERPEPAAASFQAWRQRFRAWCGETPVSRNYTDKTAEGNAAGSNPVQ